MMDSGPPLRGFRNDAEGIAAPPLPLYPLDITREASMAARKVALVTGAGTGVGRAVTLALMREGYAVVLAGRRKDMLEAVAKEGAQTPGEALTAPADVADPASIKSLFAKTKETYGRLDLLSTMPASARRRCRSRK